MKTTKNQRIVSSDSRKILQGYNKDTIALMPVNAETNFIYWEITEKLFKSKEKMSSRGSEQLIVKVFKADTYMEIYSFDVNSRIGKHYMRYSGPQKRLIAKIGFVRNEIFECILTSKPMTVSSFAKKSTDNEIWMRKSKDSYKTFRAPTVNTITEEKLQYLMAKYCSEGAASQIGSLFGSMSLSLP